MPTSGASRSTACPAPPAVTTNPPGATDTVVGAILRGLIKLPESTPEFLPPDLGIVRVFRPPGRAKMDGPIATGALRTAYLDALVASGQYLVASLPEDVP